MLKAASDTLQEPLIWVGLPYTDQAPYSAQHRHRYVYYLLLVCILVSATASLAIYVDGTPPMARPAAACCVGDDDAQLTPGCPGVMPVVLNARLAVHIAQLVSLAVGCLAAVVCVALVIVGRRRALSWAYAVTESHAMYVALGSRTLRSPAPDRFVCVCARAASCRPMRTRSAQRKSRWRSTRARWRRSRR